MIKHIENVLGIKSFEIEFDQVKDNFNKDTKLTDMDYNEWKNLFNSKRKTKPDNWKSTFELLINSYKNINSSLIITNDINKRVNNMRISKSYKINTNVFNDHMTIYKYASPNFTNICDHLKEIKNNIDIHTHPDETNEQNKNIYEDFDFND